MPDPGPPPRSTREPTLEVDVEPDTDHGAAPRPAEAPRSSPSAPSSSSGSEARERKPTPPPPLPSRVPRPAGPETAAPAASARPSPVPIAPGNHARASAAVAGSFTRAPTPSTTRPTVPSGPAPRAQPLAGTAPPPPAGPRPQAPAHAPTGTRPHAPAHAPSATRPQAPMGTRPQAQPAPQAPGAQPNTPSGPQPNAPSSPQPNAPSSARPQAPRATAATSTPSSPRPSPPAGAPRAPSPSPPRAAMPPRPAPPPPPRGPRPPLADDAARAPGGNGRAPASDQPTALLHKPADADASVLVADDALTVDDSAVIHTQPLASETTQIVSVPALAARRAAAEARPPAPPSDSALQLWREEIEVFTRESAALRSRDPARAALFDGAIAQLAATVVPDPATASAGLHAAAQLVPGGVGRERWITLLSRRAATTVLEWDLALELGRAELPLVGDPHERVALLVEVATIEELHAGDRAAARRALEEAREIDPANVAVLAALTEIYLADGEWERLVQALGSMADAASDVMFRSVLRHAAGLVQEARLAAPLAARASYKIALTDDPANLPCTTSLSSLALAQEDWGELARVLVAEADLVDDARAVRRLCERAGDLYWERLGDAENAIAAYRRAAHATPDEVAPLRKLAAVVESSGRWRELVDVYLAELPLLKDPEERADLHQRIGEVHESSLGRADDAVAAYRAALDAVPTHAPTLQALGELYRQQERWADLADMELREAERLAEAPRRAARYLEVAELVERRLGDQAHAIALYERCLDLVPGHRGAFAALDLLYRREERWREILSLYERQAQAVRDPSLVRHLRAEIGRLWRERVPNADKALAGLRDALAIEAPDLSPLLLLADTLEQTQRHEPLVDILERLIGVLRDPTDVVAALQRLGRVLELQLGLDDRALGAHMRVLELRPDDEVSLRALDRLHYRAGRWLEVITNYGRQLALGRGAVERAALYYRIGRIYERKLGRRDEALHAYEVALEHDPTYRPAFRALDRVLRRDRLWPRLLDVLARQAAAERAPLAQAQLHHAAGQIRELHLRDLVAAEQSYAAAVKLAPLYEAAVAALGHVREARGDWSGLEELYRALLARTESAAARVSVLARLGALYEWRLQQPGRAALAYREAYELSPLGQPLRGAELRALRLDGGAAATVAALAALGGRTSDKRVALGLRTLAAERDEVAARRREARPNGQLFLDAAALGHSDAAVADGVVRALVRLQAHDAVAAERLPAALVERASGCDAAAARALLLYEAACLYDRRGRMRDAALAYEQASNAVADFLPVLRGVRRIAAANEQWPAVAALLGHEAEVAADRDNRAGAFLAAAEVALNRVNDPRAALQQYRRLLDLQPQHERAFARASAIYEKLGDWVGLLELLQARAAATAEPEARAALLRQQAALQRDRLNDARGAVATLQTAVEGRAHDLDSHLMLAPLLEQLRWWQDAARSYRQISELVPGDEISRAARFKEAGIRERELGDREAARLILEELVVDETDEEAARYMAELCQRMGRWDRARELYLQLARTRDIKQRADALLALAAVLESGLDDGEGAARVYDEAFGVAQGDPEVAALIERRFRERGDWRTFVAVGERVLQKARVVSPSQVPLRLMLARAYQEELHRPDLAQGQLAVAIGMAPEDPLPSVQLGRLHLDNGRPELALPELRRALEIEPFHAEALHGLGATFLRGGLGDAARLVEEIAAGVDGSTPHGKPLAPLLVKRALDAGDGAAHFPRVTSGATAAVAEVVRQLEPFAPALLVEVTGLIPRGDLLPDANPVALRCRAVASAFNLEPLRVYVDAPNGRDVHLVADAKLALCIGGALTSPSAQGRLAFEVTRTLAWVAAGATLGAFLGPAQLAGVLQAIAQETGGDDARELRRRVLKPLPRRVRKEAERVLAEVPALGRDVAAWHAEEQRWADRVALLIGRDAGAALEAVCAGKEPRASARAVDLVRYLTSDACWRAYQRLTAA